MPEDADESDNHEILAQNGARTFDVLFLDRPGGVPVQPSRNNSATDLFDPTIPAQSNPSAFITPSALVWDEAGQAFIAPPAGYNPPTLSNLRYAGTTGAFLVDARGAGTRLSSDLTDRRWAIVFDTQVNGAAVRVSEFFVVLPDGDADFDSEPAAATAQAYGDPGVILRRAPFTPQSMGLASQGELEALVVDLNQRATSLVLNFTQRDFDLHTSDIVLLDGNDLNVLMLPGYPIVSVQEVQDTGTVLATTEYRIRRGTPQDSENAGVLERKPPGVFRDGWQRFQVTYTWGYASVPFAIRGVVENLVVRGLQAVRATKAAPGATSLSMDGFSVAFDKDMLRTLLSDDDRATLARYQRIITG